MVVKRGPVTLNVPRNFAAMLKLLEQRIFKRVKIFLGLKTFLLLKSRAKHQEWKSIAYSDFVLLL